MIGHKKVLLVLIPALLVAGGTTMIRMEDVSQGSPSAGPAAGHPMSMDASGSGYMEASSTAISENGEAVASTGTAGSVGARISASAIFSVTNGRVDAHLQNVRLPATVARIARAAGVELMGVDNLADVPVRVDLDGVPAAEALLRLTSGYDTAFAYHGSRLERMSIVAPSEARDDAVQRSAGDWAANFDRLDPEQRGDAIEMIARHGDDRAREAVAHALADSDEEVRFRALEQTEVVKGLTLPLNQLQAVLLQDASETVRLKALDVLATDPAVDAETLASIVSSVDADPSEQIRMRATQLRERLKDPRSQMTP